MSDRNRKNAPRKNLNAFVYYGGKASKLNFILPQLATAHNIFVELCAGSAAVLLNKPQAKIEVLNDLAGKVATFWQAMREDPDALIYAVMNSPAGEAEFNRILDAPATDDVVENARRFYVHIAQAFSGIPDRTSISFCKSAEGFQSARENLTAVANRMRKVVVENTDASRLISRVANSYKSRDDRHPILFYADPPYTVESRVKGSGRGVYLQDNFDHIALLETMLNAPAFCKFAVSGYDDELYNDMLSSWHRVELETRMKANNATTAPKRTEVLWRNYELDDMSKLF